MAHGRLITHQTGSIPATATNPPCRADSTEGKTSARMGLESAATFQTAHLAHPNRWAFCCLFDVQPITLYH